MGKSFLRQQEGGVQAVTYSTDVRNRREGSKMWLAIRMRHRVLTAV